MHPRELRHLFNAFGYRMLDCAWRGDLLMQRGGLELDELREAVQEGYFTTQPPDDPKSCASERAGSDIYDSHSFYRLTKKGWWEGVADGASFESPIVALWAAGCLE